MDPRPIQDLLSELGINEPDCTRVLLVDDEFEVLAVLEALLDDDWEVHTAQSGKEALEVLSSDIHIDLVITDQRMPEMTGVELLSALANRHPDLYRMVLTAYSDVDPIVAAINDGKVDQFILKPWDPQSLRRLVEEGLAVSTRRATMRAVAEALSIQFEEKNRTLKSLKGTQNRSRAGERLSTLARVAHGLTGELQRLMDRMYENLGTELGTDTAKHALSSLLRVRTLSDDIQRLSMASSLHERDEYPPRKLISDAVRLLMDEQSGESHPVHVDIDPDISHVMVDGIQITQALLSMLRNAVRASPVQTPIKVHVRRESTNLIAFEVIDEGAGMSTEAFQHAARPFFSGFTPPGTGLGLTICQMVAETHGGRLALLDNDPSGVIAQLWIREQTP